MDSIQNLGLMKFNKKKRISKTDLIIQAALIVSLVLLMAVCIVPMFHVLMSSFSDPYRLSASTGLILKPLGFSLEGYKIIFNSKTIWQGYVWTLIYVVGTVILSITLTLLAAYVTSRKNAMLRSPLMLFFIITMFFNAGIVPFAITIDNLGLYGSPLAIIIPGSCSSFSIIIMRNGMLAVPDTLEEAAKIDGAGPLKTLIKIYIPLCMSSIAIVGLFSAVGQWNSWLNASLFLGKAQSNMYPLQLVIREIILNNNNSSLNGPSGFEADFYKMLLDSVTVIVSSLPLIIAYPFFQKYFEKGMIIGGIKG